MGSDLRRTLCVDQAAACDYDLPYVGKILAGLYVGQPHHGICFFHGSRVAGDGFLNSHGGQGIVQHFQLRITVGNFIGVAFQIQDDILDVIGDGQELGKPIGSDEKNNKATYVTHAGVEEAAKQVELLSKEAVTLLEQVPGEHEFLDQLIMSLIHRKK